MKRIRIDFWKGSVLFVIALLVLSLRATAHEEPTMTKKEKKDKAKRELQIRSSKIKGSQVFKMVYEKGVDTPEKHKVFTMGYDESGRFVSIEAYKNDSLTEKDVYTYSAEGDMVGEADYGPMGEVLEKSVNEFDKTGRLMKGDSRDKDGKLTGYFKIMHGKDKKSLEFLKFGGQDSVEYRLVYKFEKDFDQSDYTEAWKYDATGKLMMKVEKKYNTAGQPTEKKIYGSDEKLLYFFVYEYDTEGNNNKISKKLADGTIDWIDFYSYDKNGNANGLKSYDKDHNLKTQLIYEFDFYE